MTAGEGVVPAKGPDDVVALATRAYLHGEPIDMSALAGQLGIGRATLYRWVGNGGRLELVLPASALAVAIVRICDVHMYAHLLGRTGPEVETALKFVRVLVGAPPSE